MRPRICDVHFKDEAVYLVSWALDGPDPSYRSFREPIIRLDREPTPSALGQAVGRALEASGAAAPQAGGRGFEAALRAAGQRGWTGLMSSSRLLSVEDNGSRVKIRASGSHLGDTTCGLDPEEIGRSLLGLCPSCPVSDPLSPARPGRSYRRRDPGAAVDGGVPSTFGYKFRWIVVDTTDAAAVASALGLKGVRPATWDIDPYHHEGVFVSPAVLGWTFVLGLYVEPHFPEFVPLLEDLSRQFGEVQYFTSHRVVELQAWAKAVDGRLTRGYCWIGERGEVVMDVGALTPEEEQLGFSRFINSRTADGDWDEVDFPNETDVMRIAGKWSINPQELDDYDSEGPGFLGELP